MVLCEQENVDHPAGVSVFFKSIKQVSIGASWRMDEQTDRHGAYKEVTLNRLCKVIPVKRIF